MHVRVLCEFVCSMRVQESEEDPKLPGTGVKEAVSRLMWVPGAVPGRLQKQQTPPSHGPVSLLV